MDITTLTKTVRDAIAANQLFASAVVFEDYGTVRSAKEAALDLTTVPPGPGYNISVWPPARGHNSESGMPSMVSADVLVVVRFEVNPASLSNLTPTDVGIWFTTRLKAIVGTVLGITVENNNTRFQVTADPFELMNFDEGLIAYHVRFSRFANFGS